MKKNKLNVKKWIKLFLLLALSSALMACSSDRNNNDNRFGFNSFGPGFGFGQNPFGSFARAVGSESAGRFQLGLEFGLVNGGDPFQGMPAQAGGELFILQPVVCNNPFPVGLNPGRWYVRTVQPGLITQAGGVSQLRLEAQGPGGFASLVIDGMVNAAIPKRWTCSGAGGFDELTAIVRVEQVNGQACNSAFYIDAYTPNCAGF